MKCPPEDVGGIGGYMGMPKVLRNPDNEEYESFLTWSGGYIDFKEFDINRLHKILVKRDYGLSQY